VRAPVAVTTLVKRAARPSYRSGGNGDITISHREYFADIASTNVFTNNQFIVNPGNATVFPWLSVIATQYESYLFDKLNFQYRTAQTTNSPGRVGMYVDYDSSDNPPANKAMAYANKNCCDGPVWHDIEFRSDRSDLHKRKSYYCNAGSVEATAPGNIAENLSDVGRLNVFTSGDSAPNSFSGELWVEYTVRLMTPSAQSPLVEQNIPLTTTEGVSSTTPFGTAASLFNGVVTDGSDDIVGWASATALNFLRPFFGQMILEYIGTGISAQIPSVGGTGTTLTTCSQEQGVGNGTVVTQIYNIAAIAGQYFTAIGLTATTLTDFRIRLYATKPNL